MSKVYVSPVVMGATYGYAFMPIDHGVFQKSKSEKQNLKRMKKGATNKGKMNTIMQFSGKPPIE